MSSELKRRILMTIAGVCICGLSIGMFSFSNLGLDPFQVFAHGTWHLTRMGFGTFYALINIVLLVLIFFVNRRKIGLGTVINLFGVGYMAEFSEWVIRHFVHTEAFGVRFLFLVLGIVVMCLAAAIYFTADLGVSTYDAIALTIAEQTRFQFRYIRITTDFICVATGWVVLDLTRLSSFPKGGSALQILLWSLGGTVGVGTIITAFFMGPLIALFNRKVAEPMWYGRQTGAAGVES